VKSPLSRVVMAGLITAAMTASAVGPAAGQIEELPDLPIAPDGAVGEILNPIEDLVEEISGPLGDALGDVPLDNAVTLTAEDAVDAAIALSLITFPSSEIAFLGRDDVFADTLSSVAGQGLAGAPLLLTQTDAIDERVAAELDRLGTTRIIILGAEQAISAGVEEQLVATYGSANVTRVGGPSRIETAADLAQQVAPAADHVLMMRAYPDAGADQSQAYADALSAGPFASSLELPSLLTTTDYLHPATRAYLESAGVGTVTLIGGEEAIAPEVESTLLDMGITVERIAGENRWDTAILVARAMGILDAADANRLILSEGGAVSEPLWAAGFAAAAHGAVYGAPVILADGPLLPPETLAFVADGLISNALRLSNEPLICNSFVDFVACETVALLMLGLLDEVNTLTGGLLETILGPAFGPLSEALEGTIPGPDEASPGLIGEVVGLIGLDGDPEDPEGGFCEDGIDNDGDGEIDEADECEAAFATAMVLQPLAVQGAVDRMMGEQGARVSQSRQAVLIDVIANLRAALGAPVDTLDPAQAEALVTILDAITATLGDRSGEVPLGSLADLVAAVDGLVEGLVETTALADLVAGLGTDAAPAVGDLTGTVSGLLAAGSGASYQSSASLVDTYGEAARPLADAVEAVTAR
jgi:putative cell wall-binding protein